MMEEEGTSSVPSGETSGATMTTTTTTTTTTTATAQQGEEVATASGMEQGQQSTATTMTPAQQETHTPPAQEQAQAPSSSTTTGTATATMSQTTPPTQEDSAGDTLGAIPRTSATRQRHATECSSDMDVEGMTEQEHTLTSRWNATSFAKEGRAISLVLATVRDNIASFQQRPLRTNKFLNVLIVAERNLLAVEQDAFEVAKFAPAYDITENFPYNGFRSQLKAFFRLLQKFHHTLLECRNERDNLFFNADSIYSSIEDYGVAMLEAFRITFASSVRLHSLLKGKRLFCRATDDPLAQELVRVSRSVDISCFYGRRAGFHLPDQIATVMQVILAAMAGFRHNFHNTQRSPNAFFRGLASAVAAVRYVITPDDQARDLVAQMRSHSVSFVKSFWNLTESTLARNMPKVTGPSLAINHVFPIQGYPILHNGPVGTIPVLPDVVSTLGNDIHQRALAQQSKYVTPDTHATQQADSTPAEPTTSTTAPTTAASTNPSDTSTSSRSGGARVSSAYAGLVLKYAHDMEGSGSTAELQRRAAAIRTDVDAMKEEGTISPLEHAALTAVLARKYAGVKRSIHKEAEAVRGGLAGVGQLARDAEPSTTTPAAATTTTAAATASAEGRPGADGEGGGGDDGDGDGAVFDGDDRARAMQKEKQEDVSSAEQEQGHNHTSDGGDDDDGTATTPTPPVDEKEYLATSFAVKLISDISLGSRTSVSDDFDTRAESQAPNFGTIRARLLSAKRREGQQPAGVGRNVAPASDTLIFHLHGGGFIANSSASHEVYLRDWAAHFDCPILSIDYALSPEHAYPRPAQEAFFAYVWALENAHALGWTGKHVLVTGDSAGGNLTVSLTLRCILEGVRLPNAIMPFYPALNVNLALSSSRMLSSLDTLLNQGVLETCLAAYAGQKVSTLDKVEITDMLMSPYHAPDHILQQLPFTVIVGLENDPLLDDALAFALRLRELGVGHELFVYESVPHGFLNFKDASRATHVVFKKTLKIMERLLQHTDTRTPPSSS